MGGCLAPENPQVVLTSTYAGCRPALLLQPLSPRDAHHLPREGRLVRHLHQMFHAPDVLTGAMAVNHTLLVPQRPVVGSREGAELTRHNCNRCLLRLPPDKRAAITPTDLHSHLTPPTKTRHPRREAATQSRESPRTSLSIFALHLPYAPAFQPSEQPPQEQREERQQQGRPYGWTCGPQCPVWPTSSHNQSEGLCVSDVVISHGAGLRHVVVK